MHPTLHLGPLDFPSYYTMLTIGYLLAVLLAFREAQRNPGVDPNKFLDLSIILLIAGLFGARLLHVLADGYLQDYINLCLDPMKVQGKPLPASFAQGRTECLFDYECVDAGVGQLCNVDAGTCHPGRDCFRWAKIWYGGLAFYGGLFFAALVAVWYIHKHRDRMNFWKVADLAGFGIALGLIFGRIGCWLAGCCFGYHTEHAIGVEFPKYSPAWDRHVEVGLLAKGAAHSLPVIPTQLIHVVSNALIFVVTYAVYKKWRKFDGIVFGLFMILYAISRFVIEFFRDDHRGVWLGNTLSTSQLLGIPTILIGIFALWWMGRRSRVTR